jgi:two-component system, OmpR family, sensor histidine kinase QseC
MAERRRAASMNRRLLAGVLGAVAVIWLGVAVVSYVDARREIDDLLDAHLAQIAGLLVVQARHELDELEAEHAPRLHRYGHRVVFQVWERGTVLRVHSSNAPNERLSEQLEGFSDTEIEGRRWRVFSTWGHKRRLLVQVGEERSARDRLAVLIGANLLKPIVLALPLLGVLVWLGVRWGTGPLTKLGAQVRQRDPSNLAPLDVADPPAEVAPLVESLNHLLERVRRSIEGERRFTADAAHELRTPIAAVRAHAEVARGATSDGERRSALASILSGCDRAAHAVDQLLTLARLDPGDADRPREPCDLRDIGKEAVADLAPMAVAKDVEVELGESPPVVVLGNRGLLAILTRNLVDNAVRYSAAHGSVRVQTSRDGGVATLVVTDQGPGIAAEDREQLGQRFHRLAGGRESGIGLGLSIVKRIAELHRARVRFLDGPGGRGLSVVVEFPLSP